MIVPPAKLLDKLLVDALTTRRHWYPKWVLFIGGPPHTLVRRTAYGEAAAAFDSAIESGAAVPIPRNKEAVCDSMGSIHLMYPHLEYQFLRILAMDAQSQDGSRMFLEVAAHQFALDRCGGNHTHEEAVVELWSIWYQYNLHTPYFITALVETEKFVVRVAGSMRAFDV